MRAQKCLSKKLKRKKQNLQNLPRDEKIHWQKLKNGKIIQLEFRVKDKGSWFVVLNDDGYVHKVEDQINRSSFLQ